MTNIFFLLFGGLQGILLSMLCWRKQKGLAGLFFTSFLLLATLQIFLKVIGKTWLMDHLRGLYKISYELPFLFGPILYLFFYTYYHPKKKWRNSWLLHFMPFVFFALIRSWNIYYFHYHPEVNSWRTLVLAFHPVVGWKMWLHMSLQWISLWYYGLAAANILKSRPDRPHWHSPLIWIVLLVESLIIIVLKLMTLYYGHYADPRWLFLSLTLLIYWLSYQVLASSPLQLALPRVTPKYEKSGLHPSQIDGILQQLKDYMRKQKPFLNPELSIDQIAKALELPKHHLSQAINSGLKQNFSEFLNTYRISEAKTLLQDSKQNHLTIAAIAFEAGFKSLSHFNSTFKKVVQTPPSTFRKNRQAKIVPDLSDKKPQ
ncbi:MAG: AraC family transcriptional regulator [Saprospiraceae bacterium]|nr:AraC family transcriptional regulator [Saprospiraceae bacterium]